jgi:protein involved in polysaccharide export with SLBB domain
MTKHSFYFFLTLVTIINSQNFLSEQLKLQDSIIKKSETQVNIDDTISRDPKILVEPTTVNSSNRFEINYFKNSNPSLFSSVSSSLPKDYPLKPGDKIILTITGEPNSESELTVNNQGYVRISNYGSISINGQTIESAKKLIIDFLKPKILGIEIGSTNVNLRISKVSPIKIFVTGEVQKPGSFVFDGNVNILMALFASQGPTSIGSLRKVTIKRGGSIRTFDFYDYFFKSANIHNINLYDGDIINISTTTKLVNISGSINRPGIYDLKRHEKLNDLIVFSGGFSATFSNTPIKIIRYSNGIRTIKNINFNTNTIRSEVKNGDSIVIPSSSSRIFNKVTIRGSVFNEGDYEWNKNLTLQDLIRNAGGLLPEGSAEGIQIFRSNFDGSYNLIKNDSNILQTILKSDDSIQVYPKSTLNIQQNFQIIGSIKNPGNYPLRQNQTLYDAIVSAGGLITPNESFSLKYEKFDTLKNAYNLNIFSFSHLNDSKSFKINPNAKITIQSDTNFQSMEFINVDGFITNPGIYTLSHKGETFKSFYQRVVKLDSFANLKALVFTRNQPIIKHSVDSLGIATVVIDTTQKRLNINSEKILNGTEADFPLRSGDKIYIPEFINYVSVNGEVISPGDVKFHKNWSVDDYLNGSGGLSITADKKRIYVTYPNGEKSIYNRLPRSIEPGSQIFVSYKKPPPEVSTSEELKSWATVIGSIASTITAILVAYATIN